MNADLSGEPRKLGSLLYLLGIKCRISWGNMSSHKSKGSFEKLRNSCTDPDVLYIAKMFRADAPEAIIPKQNKRIIAGDIGTPNGIVPFHSAGKAEWGMRYGGDYDYYNNLSKSVKDVVFLDISIYKIIR